MNKLHEVELTVEQTVTILSMLASPDRRDDELSHVRSGFQDGLNGKDSQAKPGTDPDMYASGYQFGVQLRDLVFWTHELQADADRLP